jgi:tyrosyl-tRNA synthetase
MEKQETEIKNRQPATRLKSAVAEQIELIKRGTAEIIPEAELVKKLERSASTGKSLRIKFGIDPTGSEIHLGHTVPIRKLKHFQELGHEIVFLIGDFTAQIGDPTGRSESRPPLTKEQCLENARTYFDQISVILDMSKVEIVYNSTWLESLNFSDVIKLAANFTVARMLEREDFSKRYSEGRAIGLHEFLYPMMQGYDSVALNADVEIGATEQTFNLLAGRQLQQAYGQEPQVVITLPILVGLDGTQKMSKSAGNYIGITDAPEDMYGKIMSISDKLMIDYYELLTDIGEAEIEEIKQSIANGTLHPRDAKMRLAHEIVCIYHGREAADWAQERFRYIFQQGRSAMAAGAEALVKPEEITIPSEELNPDGTIWICKLMTLAGLTASNTEARRLVEQNAVSVNGEKINDPKSVLKIDESLMLQVGKRKYVRISASTPAASELAKRGREL